MLREKQTDLNTFARVGNKQPTATFYTDHLNICSLFANVTSARGAGGSIADVASIVERRRRITPHASILESFLQHMAAKKGPGWIPARKQTTTSSRRVRDIWRVTYVFRQCSRVQQGTSKPCKTSHAERLNARKKKHCCTGLKEQATRRSMEVSICFAGHPCAHSALIQGVVYRDCCVVANVRRLPRGTEAHTVQNSGTLPAKYVLLVPGMYALSRKQHFRLAIARERSRTSHDRTRANVMSAPRYIRRWVFVGLGYLVVCCVADSAPPLGPGC